MSHEPDREPSYREPDIRDPEDPNPDGRKPNYRQPKSPEPAFREPIFNIPASAAGLAIVLVAIHIGRQFIPDRLDEWVVAALGFIPMRYDSHTGEWPGGWASAVLSPVSHFLIHGDLMHLGINVAMLVAFGGLVARRLNTLRLLAFLALCSAVGALLFYIVNAGEAATMIGASGGISGLMAAGLRLMFSALDGSVSRGAGDLLRHATPYIPLQPLGRALMDARLRLATGVWFAVNLMSAFGLGGPPDAGAIAWEAHIGGFLAGLLAYGAFDRGARADKFDEPGDA